MVNLPQLKIIHRTESVVLVYKKIYFAVWVHVNSHSHHKHNCTESTTFHNVDSWQLLKAEQMNLELPYKPNELQ